MVDVEVVVVERVVDVGLVGASGQSVQHLLHLRRSGLLPPSDKHRLHTPDRLPDASALANSEMQSLLSYLPQVSVEVVAVVVRHRASGTRWSVLRSLVVLCPRC